MATTIRDTKEYKAIDKLNHALTAYYRIWNELQEQGVSIDSFDEVTEHLREAARALIPKDAQTWFGDALEYLEDFTTDEIFQIIKWEEQDLIDTMSYSAENMIKLKTGETFKLGKKKV